MFLTRLMIVGRRTFYMRGLYITSVAYWHLGHFEAILNVICHKYMITFNHIQRFLFVKLFIFKSSSFIFITPKVQGLLSYQIQICILIWNNIRSTLFSPNQNCKTHVPTPRRSKLSSLCQCQKFGN